MKKARIFQVTCLSLCIVLFVPMLFADLGEAATLPPGNVSEEVDLLVQMVEDTERRDWRWPSRIRKAVVLRKLNVVSELVQDGNFSDAYDKMLRDIKPKLTGLKTDENEETWAQGWMRFRWFWWSWIRSNDMKEEFRIQCNTILYLLTQPVLEDDDTTAPTIVIDYSGDYHAGNPGEWTINIEDIESGLDEVIISVDGIIVVHDTGLSGLSDLSYYISVPAVVGTHIVEVTAINYDIDWPGDQESDTTSRSTDILTDPGDPPPPPIIIG